MRWALPLGCLIGLAAMALATELMAGSAPTAAQLMQCQSVAMKEKARLDALAARRELVAIKAVFEAGGCMAKIDVKQRPGAGQQGVRFGFRFTF